MISTFRKELIEETIRMNREMRRRRNYIKKGKLISYNQERINWLYHQIRVNYCLICKHTSILEVF